MLQSKALLKVATLSQAEVATFDSLNSVGGKVWPSAEHFVSYFENNSIDLSGKSVLELGSGCGYTGIALAILGASRVVLTDQLIKQGRSRTYTIGEAAFRLLGSLPIDFVSVNGKGKAGRNQFAPRGITFA